MRTPTRTLPLSEFVIMLAMMISIVALATDMMLPCLRWERSEASWASMMRMMCN